MSCGKNPIGIHNRALRDFPILTLKTFCHCPEPGKTPINHSMDVKKTVGRRGKAVDKGEPNENCMGENASSGVCQPIERIIVTNWSCLFC